MKHETIAPQDQSDHDLGLELIRVLQLKRKRDNGRIETTHGDKNPCGLARTVRHLSASPLEQAAPELLDIAQRWIDWANGPVVLPIADRLNLEAETRAAIHKATQA